ncbi:MAG: diguanylate cyclase [Methylibium sp.]|uniref:diguanylate cyclase n=1 Tax=Methylibium sp. TaxID=2067992 RepID=UPI0017ECB3D1|nr:diguanylate cyclase [Methylibium sp.]MBA3596536.1 diguanylate cyclase [Methylibium sp.]
MKKPSPLLQMTLALVGLCGTLVLLADLFFGVLPDSTAQTMELRKRMGEALAVQVAALLQTDDRGALQRTLDSVATRTDDVRSLAIRRADGAIVLQGGDHARNWQSRDTDVSNLEQVTVKLNADGAPWGSFEVAFAREEGNAVLRLLRQPLMVMLLFMSAAGMLVFWLYMRRALQHLDPSSVIPERVQGAFDAMAEGVVALDARGRVLLANKHFRGLHPEAAAVGVGRNLSDLPWLCENLSSTRSEHPWALAMSDRAASAGYTLEVGTGSPDARQLVINCAPITDPGGTVRGSLVTFNDVTALQRANESLRQTMTALTSSNEEVQRQNTELERLATRDPLTGCLNRRAFLDAFEARLSEAHAANSPLSCVMLDIDHFKLVNDDHGHVIGDRVIQEVAKKLFDSTRSADLVCRYGGEEFCVVLPGLGMAAAAAFAERVRERILTECGPGVREVENLRITVSLGVEALSSQAVAAPALIDRADQALYRAKRSGRNRVCAFEPEGAAPANSSDADVLRAYLTPAAFQSAFMALLGDASVRSGVLSGVKLAVDPYRALLAGPGPQAADQAVRMVARVLKQCARPNDLLVRIDAEHFGIVSPGLSIQDALAFAERVRAQVQSEGADAAQEHPARRLTVTAGVDALPANALGASTLIERAGKALLRARRNGNNRVGRFAAGQETIALNEAPASAKTEESLP